MNAHFNGDGIIDPSVPQQAHDAVLPATQYQVINVHPIWPVAFAERDIDDNGGINMSDITCYDQFYGNQDGNHSQSTVRDRGVPSPQNL